MGQNRAKFASDLAANKFEEFASTLNFNEGYAVTNRFEVLVFPPALLASAPVDTKDISLRCKDVTLPGRNLNTLTDSNIYGPTREIVNGVTYAEDISMNFIASADLWERVFFEEWQQLAFNDATWDLGYYNDYIGEIDIYILNRQNERRFGIRLLEAFPKTIGGTGLNHDDQNSIITLGITFVFRYWQTLDINRNPYSSMGGGFSITPEEQREAVKQDRGWPGGQGLGSLPSGKPRRAGNAGNASNNDGTYENASMKRFGPHGR